MNDLLFDEEETLDDVDVTTLPQLTQYAVECQKLDNLYTKMRQAHVRLAELQEGLGEVDAIEVYRLWHESKQQIESILSAVKKKLEAGKEELTGYFRSQGATAMTRDGFSYSLSSRVYAQVELDTFIEWVLAQDEPQSTYLETTAKKKVLNTLVLEARKSNPGREEDILPDGVGFHTIEIITVREKKTNSKPRSARGELTEIMEGE